jgi:hypothetical protein
MVKKLRLARLAGSIWDYTGQFCTLFWNFRTISGGWEQGRNRVPRTGPPGYRGCRAGTTTRFLATIDCSTIPALYKDDYRPHTLKLLPVNTVLRQNVASHNVYVT